MEMIIKPTARLTLSKYEVFEAIYSKQHSLKLNLQPYLFEIIACSLPEISEKALNLHMTSTKMPMSAEIETLMKETKEVERDDNRIRTTLKSLKARARYKLALSNSLKGKSLKFDLQFMREQKEVMIPSSRTISEFKQLLARTRAISSQYLTVLINGRQIPVWKENARFEEYAHQPPRFIEIMNEVQTASHDPLLQANELAPRVERCLRIIFSRLAQNGLISFPDLVSYVSLCLCDRRKQQQLTTNLFRHYLDENRMLSLREFLRFYREACDDRPHAVIQNLNVFRVLPCYCFRDEDE